MSKLDKSFWSQWEVMLLVFIVIVSLVIAGGYFAYGAFFPSQEPGEAGAVVKEGDTVSVNYIGMFEDGTVFDTSLPSVAENNTLYPKSLSFTSRDAYSPLEFVVGSGSMIHGFDIGVIGMAVNQTKVIEVLPDDGYGYPNENLFTTISLTDTHPVFEWVENATEFQSVFFQQPQIGATVTNPAFGWNMTVYYIDTISGQIMLKNEPLIGEIAHIYNGWNSQVLSIDTTANSGMGEITIKHLLTSADIGKKIITDEEGRQFIISAVDSAAGTATLDFNTEVVGKTLYFKVTIVSITPGTS